MSMSPYSQQPYDSFLAIGYGDTAPQSSLYTLEASTPFEPPRNLAANHEVAHYAYPTAPQYQHTPLDNHEEISSNEMDHEASNYEEAYLSSELPPEGATPLGSFGIPTPEEPSSQFYPSQSTQMVPHNHIVEASSQMPPSQRPEQSPSDADPLLQTVVNAFQHFLPPNSGGSHVVSVKITKAALAAFLRLLRAQPWFANQEVEPRSITETDVFVVHEYVDARAASRLHWLIFQDPEEHFHCRIPHSWRRGEKKGQECDHNVHKLKDAIAHVHEYLEYRPHPCLGTTGHSACDLKFYTPERRYDHYCKKRTKPDQKVKCPLCNTETLERNLARHTKKKHPQPS